jgi:hypothetical protein
VHVRAPGSPTVPVQPGVIALWSVPRSCSTAFLRMMIERGDTAVVHEPFSHVADFGQTTVAGEVVRSHEAAMAAICRLSAGGPVFFKDTTEQRYTAVLADESFLRSARHAFLIRDPRKSIASHYALDPDLMLDRIGYQWLCEVHGRVREVCGEDPLVFEAEELVEHPAETVARFCAWAGLPYVAGALSWAAGEQIQWSASKAWHSDVSASTGFVKHDWPARADVTADPVLSAYYRYHLPFYEHLRACAGKHIHGTQTG